MKQEVIEKAIETMEKVIGYIDADNLTTQTVQREAQVALETIRQAVADDWWRPIETAPRDGTPIWSWITSPNEKSYPISSWCLISWSKQQEEWVGHVELFGRFTGTRLKEIHGGLVPIAGSRSLLLRR